MLHISVTFFATQELNLFLEKYVCLGHDDYLFMGFFFIVFFVDKLQLKLYFFHIYF